MPSTLTPQQRAALDGQRAELANLGNRRRMRRRPVRTRQHALSTRYRARG